MAQDLESLRAEMEAYLEDSGLAVFHGHHHLPDSLVQVSWDTERHPNFRDFLGAAQKAGVKLFVFHSESFSLDQVDEALDQLEETDFTREEKRSYEARLRQLQAYEGFTCAVELSFSLDGRVYVYEAHTDWYQSLNEIVAELDAALEEEEDESDGSMGGYFSKN
jgi:hypothetical protein